MSLIEIIASLVILAVVGGLVALYMVRRRNRKTETQSEAGYNPLDDFATESVKVPTTKSDARRFPSIRINLLTSRFDNVAQAIRKRTKETSTPTPSRIVTPVTVEQHVEIDLPLHQDQATGPTQLGQMPDVATEDNTSNPQPAPKPVISEEERPLPAGWILLTIVSTMIAFALYFLIGVKFDENSTAPLVIVLAIGTLVTIAMLYGVFQQRISYARQKRSESATTVEPPMGADKSKAKTTATTVAEYTHPFWGWFGWTTKVSIVVAVAIAVMFVLGVDAIRVVKRIFATSPAPVYASTTTGIAESVQPDTLVPIIGDCESGNAGEPGTAKQFYPGTTDVVTHTNTNGTTDFGYLQINSDHLEDPELKAKRINIMTEAGNIEFGRILIARNGLKDWSASEDCIRRRLQGSGYSQFASVEIEKTLTVKRGIPAEGVMPKGWRIDAWPDLKLVNTQMVYRGPNRVMIFTLKEGVEEAKFKIHIYPCSAAAPCPPTI